MMGNENIAKLQHEYGDEIQKISPRIYANKKFRELLEKAANLMYEEFNPSYVNQNGPVTRGVMHSNDYYFRVSDDGNSINYGYSQSNPSAINNGYTAQHIAYGFEISLNDEGNLVVTSKGGSFDEKIDNSNKDQNTYMEYTGTIYDKNGNIIKIVSIDKITALSDVNLKEFTNQVNYHHCPDFGDQFRPLNSSKAGKYAASSTKKYKFSSVERNMLNPSIVHYIDSERTDGRDFSTLYFGYPESFWTIQIDSQFPDRLYHYPSIPEEYKKDRITQDLLDRAAVVESEIYKSTEERIL